MNNCLECFGEFKNGLSDMEVKKFFKLEYGSKWRSKYTSFMNFMCGQTMCRVEGTAVYYRCDIENFMRPKAERFFD